MCLSHLIYTVRPCLIHICNAMPMPCSVHAVLLKATAQHSLLSTSVLCCGLEKNGIVGEWHGDGIASVNQTWPHCVTQMGKTHSKPLAARHGRGTAWERRAMCESAFSVTATDYDRHFPTRPRLISEHARSTCEDSNKINRKCASPV